MWVMVVCSIDSPLERIADYFFSFFFSFSGFKLSKATFCRGILSWDFLKFDLELYELPHIEHGRTARAV